MVCIPFIGVRNCRIGGVVRKYHYSVILVIPVLLGIFVSLCGILLSLGFRKLSLLCFFVVLGLLLLAAIVKRYL